MPIVLIIAIILLFYMSFYKNKLLEDKIKEQDNYIYSLRTLIVALRQENYIQRNKQKTTNIAAMLDGILDAVKIAMKVSHPDNGGKTADFIKHNELYKKLSK